MQECVHFWEHHGRCYWCGETQTNHPKGGTDKIDRDTGIAFAAIVISFLLSGWLV